jgi:hypothetical protein
MLAPVILFTWTDLHIDSLCATIDVDFISKADGVLEMNHWCSMRFSLRLPFGASFYHRFLHCEDAVGAA